MVLLDYGTVGHRQALARAFADCLGRKERIEYPILDFVRHAATGIRNLDLDFVAQIVCRDLDCAFLASCPRLSIARLRVQR